mmetsp:Transcript_45345/g.145412  ORF Transcript_45345/g.145412 Transcript_45345/m.145412 type:complete len:342 (-) Transcript_45345:299-1324(-)
MQPSRGQLRIVHSVRQAHYHLCDDSAGVRQARSEHRLAQPGLERREPEEISRVGPKSPGFGQGSAEHRRCQQRLRRGIHRVLHRDQGALHSIVVWRRCIQPRVDRCLCLSAEAHACPHYSLPDQLGVLPGGHSEPRVARPQQAKLADSLRPPHLEGTRRRHAGRFCARRSRLCVDTLGIRARIQQPGRLQGPPGRCLFAISVLHDVLLRGLQTERPNAGALPGIALEMGLQVRAHVGESLRRPGSAQGSAAESAAEPQQFRQRDCGCLAGYPRLLPRRSLPSLVALLFLGARHPVVAVDRLSTGGLADASAQPEGVRAPKTRVAAGVRHEGGLGQKHRRQH